MSTSHERAHVLGQIRATLVDLIDDGVLYVPPAPPRARVASEPAIVRGADVATAVPSLAAAPAGSSAADALLLLRETLGDCKRCKLCEKRNKIVFGEGNPQAKVVFVGEGPGAEEDRTGRPFVGAAGELLTKMIEACGWKREEVYICNVVKCRPPQNRDPMPDEVASCRPFLEGQLEALRPQVIVTLGKPATSTLLERPVAITQLRGHWQSWRGIPLMPTYHPAYLLRNYTRKTRQEVWDDLRAVHARLV